jgi:hypothetical protein
MLKSHSYIVIGYFPAETSITGTPLVVLWRAESPRVGRVFLVSSYKIWSNISPKCLQNPEIGW